MLITKDDPRPLKVSCHRKTPERFGHVPAVPEGVAVWVHAVSVGEALAAAPLIRALIERHGPGEVYVTSGTPTGSARVQALFGDRVRHSYAPYDLPHAVARFVDRVRPRVAVVMETELCIYGDRILISEPSQDPQQLLSPLIRQPGEAVPSGLKWAVDKPAKQAVTKKRVVHKK